jgi:hypothetical protein
MGNLLQAKAIIKGTRPILWHAFTADAIPLEKQERTGVAGNDPEEWRKTVLVTEGRQLYLDATYIFGCLRDASRHTKQGRGSIQSNLVATLQVLNDRVLVDRWMPEKGDPPTDQTQPVYIDVRSVRNPATKGRNVRYRVGASTGWRATFNILWDKTIVNRAQMESVITDAGRLAGLGDGRSVGYGRFTTESFDVSDAS